MKKVGIIGGSGFIGSHVTKIFLDNGFEVRVSSTDISNEDKYQHLMILDHSDKLHIAELNVENKQALRDFVQDCDIVIHSGTPFQLDVKDPKTELFDPTVKGTENFLEVISQMPSVAKVVVVASVAAINDNFPIPAKGKNPDETYDESDKFTSSESHPYGQAKFLANQTVQKFTLENPDSNVEITSVSPVLVVGNSMSGREDSTSTRLQFLFRNKIAPNPFVQMLYDNDVEFAVVDVADVAKAIFKAATTKGLHGRNYLLSHSSFSVSDLSLLLNGQRPKTNGRIIYKNDLAKRDLDLEFGDITQTLHFGHGSHH
ncbi:NAD-dependent epimerase/dehydratase family protein [Flavobacterium sp.]|uniref:NAD-dependent epimerase/dehydratase family protein n=1 Tax=Flavobacterium sp. TaxID=239 RepID=UPI0011F6185D|nr:NAD-dependent epimerase/dehydratase family protein [Flavobacterium sp.]RZJ69099.1 MAG: NAD-dependent epimerase/dehydratase family protein [Flavobacterium sp.]